MPKQGHWLCSTYAETGDTDRNGIAKDEGCEIMAPDSIFPKTVETGFIFRSRF